MRMRTGHRAPGPRPMLHDDEAFARLRSAGALAAKTLDFVGGEIEAGVTTDRLDQLCHGFLADHGARPAPLGYRGFPRATCISVDDVVCHGVPNQVALVEGQILNVDVAVILDGYYGDASRMFAVGKTARAAIELCEAAYGALMAGVATVEPGATLGDVGHAVQRAAEAAGGKIVREFGGHGLGRAFHEPPLVLHYGKRGEGMRLEPGMAFTIEPMVNAKSRRVVFERDGWTVRTADGALSAQWEHMVGVTEDGVEIFTLSERELAGAPPFDWAD